jgi:hypothetical protein
VGAAAQWEGGRPPMDPLLRSRTTPLASPLTDRPGLQARKGSFGRRPVVSSTDHMAHVSDPTAAVRSRGARRRWRMFPLVAHSPTACSTEMWTREVKGPTWQ